MKRRKLFLSLVVAAVLSVNTNANEYLTLTNNSTRRVCNVTLQINGTMTNVPTLEYQLDKDEWKDVVYNESVSLEYTKSIKFRAKGENVTFNESKKTYVKFVLTGDSVFASGNVMSLLDSTCKRTDVPEYAFIYLFSNCRALISAPELPATTLSDYCYYAMFRDCGKLITPPVLPATKMKKACYCDMFMSCVSLRSTTELPSTELAENCYNSMFFSCARITTPPELPATELFHGCYATMFTDCPQLIEAPDLPAMEIAEDCYRMMFHGCENLVKIPHELPALKLYQESYYLMFGGCNSLTTTPIIRATEFEQSTMTQMFKNSKNINKVEVCFKTIASGQANCMLQGVSEKGTFICPKGSDKTMLRTLLSIPSEWVIEEKEDVPQIVITGSEYPNVTQTNDSIPCDLNNVKVEKNTTNKIVKNGQVVIQSAFGDFNIMGGKL